MKHLLVLLAGVVFYGIIGVLWWFSYIDIWTSATLVVLFTVFGVMVFQFETRKLSSKEVSLIAMMSGLSAAARIPFAAVPSVQPCTFLILYTGYVFGPVAGFMVGAVTALVSNLFLGQGPWTMFQMLAWGLVGITAAILPKLHFKKIGILIFGVVWGFLFGWIMNLWYWLAFIYPHTWTTLVFALGSSLWFDVLHAVGNAIFILLLGEKTMQILLRFKQRFHVTFIDSKHSSQPSIG